ncbi:MAG: hypothetical protein ACTSU3_05030 [Candidatus Thorarchaeota archaeon]
MTKEFELYIKGQKIGMNDFVRNVIHDVILAFISHLHGTDIEEISKIEVS